VRSRRSTTTAGNEASRSALAEELFDAALDSGEIEQARALLRRISNPDKLAEIAVGERTRPLWDDVAGAMPRRAPR
jgi:hypothetical protein